MIIHAKVFNGEVYPLSPEDEEKLKQAFPDGRVVLTSENCPELAAAMKKASDELLIKNRDAYERLARFD